MGRRENKAGKRGEEIARRELAKIGVYNIEKIGTPFTITQTKKIGNRIFYAGFFGEKVAADWRGETENGVSVLCEVKTTHNKNLTWSALRPHQPAKLSNHRGISLLVWVYETDWSEDVYIMRWDDMLSAGFCKGHGITPIMASGLHIDFIDILPESGGHPERLH